MKIETVALIPEIEGTSGPASFHRRIAQGLAHQAIRVVEGETDPDVALVIGATRRLDQLWSLGRRGIPIVQRLDGMNWIHRRAKTGIRHYVKAEYRNFLLRFIRNRFAQHVVYQSEFAMGWWGETYGGAPCAESVVHNAVPLEIFSPDAERKLPKDRCRPLILEGNFAGGYETGLRASFDMLAHLQTISERLIELTVVGSVPERIKGEFEDAPHSVEWLGVLQQRDIPQQLNKAHILLSADINPACPNSVIEALACGIPVVGFNTGAMEELMTDECGRLANYGSDPWRLEPPNIAELAESTLEVLDDLERFRIGARKRAEQAFGLNKMVAGYLRAFNQALEG
jgi:glycosyltransferase involved in cell wall biosynthesis